MQTKQAIEQGIDGVATEAKHIADQSSRAIGKVAAAGTRLTSGMADLAKRVGSGVQKAAGKAERMARGVAEFAHDMKTKARRPEGA